MLVDTRQIPCAVQPRIVRTLSPGIGEKFLGRQIGPAQIPAATPGPVMHSSPTSPCGKPTRKRARGAGRKTVGLDHLHHHQAVIGQRRTDGHRLARP